PWCALRRRLFGRQRSVWMRHTPVVLAGIALALLGGARPANADPIKWSYNWSRSPAEVHADFPGTGFISLTDEGTVLAEGNTDVVATTLQTHSTATADNPDVFTDKLYAVTINITDTLTGQSGSMTFHGVLNGTITADSSNIKNQFTGQTEQTLVLGNKAT